MPSGMLWSAIAIPKLIPIDKSLYDVIKVAIPSGKLCAINAIILRSPTLYRLLLLESRDTFLFMHITIILPKMNTAMATNKAQANPYEFVSVFTPSGINSNTDNVIITLNEKLSAKDINPSLSLKLINTTSPPNSVLNPANEAIIKGINILFILSLV